MDILTSSVAPSWKVFRLGQLFHERKTKVSDKDYEPLSVTMKGIVTQLETAAKSDDSENRKLVLKGDFAINSRSDRKGGGWDLALGWIGFLDQYRSGAKRDCPRVCPPSASVDSFSGGILSLGTWDRCRPLDDPLRRYEEYPPFTPRPPHTKGHR